MAVLPEGQFGPLAVNVADQRRDSESLLSWMERLVRRRRETPGLGWGATTILEPGDDAVLAHRCDWEGSAVVAIHNLSPTPRELRLGLGPMDEGTRVVDLLDGEQPVRGIDGAILEIKLAGFGYHWFRLEAGDAAVTP